jgi:glycosyltransferase A (GT-A) superfamily protein (DUF2064 family)
VRLDGVCAIAVMAKAPRPGHVKTRLQGLLTAEEAAQVGAAFLADVTANVRAAAEAAPVHGYVAYAPAGHEARFDGVVAPGSRLVLADGALGEAPGVEGFGRSLLHAVRTLLDMGYGAACVLNADSPTLPTAWLAGAARRLLIPGRRAVIGPADDGGYWLLGVQAPESELFSRIAWSTDAVAAATSERALGIGLPMDRLGTWFDIDDRAGLQRLVRSLGEPAPAGGADAPFAAPATARCVAALGLRSRLGALAPES